MDGPLVSSSWVEPTSSSRWSGVVTQRSTGSTQSSALGLAKHGIKEFSDRDGHRGFHQLSRVFPGFWQGLLMKPFGTPKPVATTQETPITFNVSANIYPSVFKRRMVQTFYLINKKTLEFSKQLSPLDSRKLGKSPGFIGGISIQNAGTCKKLKRKP